MRFLNRANFSMISCLRSPRFWVALLLGQFLSLCITTTNVTTKLLSTVYDINIPTTQSFGNYLLLATVFSTYTIFRYGFTGYKDAVRNRGLFYLCLALVDVEANYFIVKGFAKTSYLSAMLINAFSTPGVAILSCIFLKARYQWFHFFGISLSLVGLFLLIVSDILTEKSYQGENPLVGDLYCVIGALLYSVSNITEEYFVRKYPNWEILGFLGLFGTLINGLQLVILEQQELSSIHVSPPIVNLYLGFTFAMFFLYSLVPSLIEKTSATFYNISLLTSDFYGLIFGLVVFKSKTHPLYPFAFCLIIVGLLIYNLYSPSSETIGGDMYKDIVLSPTSTISSEGTNLIPSSSRVHSTQYGTSTERNDFS